MRGDYDWASDELSDELGSRWDNDEIGHTLLHMALYDMDEYADIQHAAYEAFIEYMEEFYDYDLEEGFDWDAFREWYDSQ